MSQTENDSLKALEKLLDEFFNHSTSNARKHEIENQLHSFRNQRDCWKYCIYFLAHTSSQYVCMYSISTIESVINRQWTILDWEHKVQLKNALHNNLVEQDTAGPHFVRNKLAKLLVDIARFDWPHFYPDFFINILQCLQSEQRQMVGLILLRISSEELMNPRPDLSSYRKEELNRLVQQHIPQVFQILYDILEDMSKKPRHSATATPPPSPTHPGCAPNLTKEITAASFRPDYKDITKEALAAAQHIFSWVNLAEVPMQLVRAIFHFTNISSYAQDDDDICVLAMSTLNELLYRKCVPPSSQNFFIELYHHTIQLLQEIISPNSDKIETLGANFIAKLSELLELLIEQHLWRLEADPGFSALELLSLLFQLTIQVPSVMCYLKCLSVWCAFIKQLKTQNAHKYFHALVSLVSTVLNKIQFMYNRKQLEELKSDWSDNEEETEWQLFLKASIELIAMVAEYSPYEVFNAVLVPWESTNDICCILENAVDHINLTLNYVEIYKSDRLKCILRDFASLTQTLGRLSNFFVEENATKIVSSPAINRLVNKLIESGSIATNSRFYILKISDRQLVECIAEAHSQLLASLKPWLPWLSQQGELNSLCVTHLLEICLPILTASSENPPKVNCAASHLLLTLTSILHPPTLLLQASFVGFIQVAPSLKFVGHQTKEVVDNAICNVLVRSWGELSLADINQRDVLITFFFDSITKDFRELNADSYETKVKEVVGNTLPPLSRILRFYKNYPLSSKKFLYLGLKGFIDHALELFPAYSKYSEVSDHILSLFVEVLRVLMFPFGLQNTQKAIQVFLEVAISQQRCENLSGLDKLLKILQLVVEIPGPAYKSFFTGILQLCLEHIHPLVVSHANEQPDVVIALLSLLRSICIHWWPIFYISQVRLGNSPGYSVNDSRMETLQHPHQMLSILQLFGQALLQSDINIFRTSLAALEDLNSKWKLYHKALFRDQLLNEFLTVLFHTLLDKTHALLMDDILTAVYNMASVNFDFFFESFIPNFLQKTEGLVQAQKNTLQNTFQKETDMPTFLQNTIRFVDDMRCYKLCNATQPLGSVIL